jgi:hypothetical protein
MIEEDKEKHISIGIQEIYEELMKDKEDKDKHGLLKKINKELEKP